MNILKVCFRFSIFLSIVFFSPIVYSQDLNNSINGEWDYNGDTINVLQRQGSDNVSFTISFITEELENKNINFKGTYNTGQLHAKALVRSEIASSPLPIYLNFDLVADYNKDRELNGQVILKEAYYYDQGGRFQILNRFDPYWGPLIQSLETVPFSMRYNGVIDTSPIPPQPIQPQQNDRPSFLNNWYRTASNLSMNCNQQRFDLTIHNMWNYPIVCQGTMIARRNNAPPYTFDLRGIIIAPGASIPAYIDNNNPFFYPIINCDANIECKWAN